MSRGTAARRRRDDGQAWYAESSRVASELDELTEQGDRLGAENARLREQVAEVEGWYRLLQADHAVLQARAARSGRRIGELQAEANRLAAENQGLQAVAFHGAAGPGIIRRRLASMARITDFIRTIRRHRWAAAVFVALATLAARDSAVRGVLRSALDGARQVAGGGEDPGRASADSGFLAYAAMVNGHEQAERARRDYNEHEAGLKGDALLEAQDRLRAAKARYRQARLAFLPELARRCGQAGVPLPGEAARALAELNKEVE